MISQLLTEIHRVQLPPLCASNVGIEGLWTPPLEIIARSLDALQHQLRESNATTIWDDYFSQCRAMVAVTFQSSQSLIGFRLFVISQILGQCFKSGQIICCEELLTSFLCCFLERGSSWLSLVELIVQTPFYEDCVTRLLVKELEKEEETRFHYGRQLSHSPMLPQQQRLLPTASYWNETVMNQFHHQQTLTNHQRRSNALPAPLSLQPILGSLFLWNRSAGSCAGHIVGTICDYWMQQMLPKIDDSSIPLFTTSLAKKIVSHWGECDSVSLLHRSLLVDEIAAKRLACCAALTLLLWMTRSTTQNIINDHIFPLQQRLAASDKDLLSFRSRVFAVELWVWILSHGTALALSNCRDDKTITAIRTITQLLNEQQIATNGVNDTDASVKAKKKEKKKKRDRDLKNDRVRLLTAASYLLCHQHRVVTMQSDNADDAVNQLVRIVSQEMSDLSLPWRVLMCLLLTSTSNIEVSADGDNTVDISQFQSTMTADIVHLEEMLKQSSMHSRQSLLPLPWTESAIIWKHMSVTVSASMAMHFTAWPAAQHPLQAMHSWTLRDAMSAVKQRVQELEVVHSSDDAQVVAADRLTALPVELLTEIWCYLPYKRLLTRVARTCRSLHTSIVQNNTLWQRIYARSFPRSCFLSELHSSCVAVNNSMCMQTDVVDTAQSQQDSEDCPTCLMALWRTEGENGHLGLRPCRYRSDKHLWRLRFQHKIEALTEARKQHVMRFRLCPLVGCNHIIKSSKEELEEAHLQSHLRASTSSRKRKSTSPSSDLANQTKRSNTDRDIL